MAQVTEEIMRKAQFAFEMSASNVPTTKLRAALESVADDLRAEGMEEARGVMNGIFAELHGGGNARRLLTMADNAIQDLARSNQLSPTSKGDGE